MDKPNKLPKRRCYINTTELGKFKLIYRVLVLEEAIFSNLSAAMASAKFNGFTHAELDGLKEVEL